MLSQTNAFSHSVCVGATQKKRANCHVSAAAQREYRSALNRARSQRANNLDHFCGGKKRSLSVTLAPVGQRAPPAVCSRFLPPRRRAREREKDACLPPKHNKQSLMLGARCSLFAPLANKGALVFDDPLNDTTRAAFLLASSCAQPTRFGEKCNCAYGMKSRSCLR